MWVPVSFRRLFSRLASSRSGNVAMIFTLSLAPIIVLSGASIDLARTQGSQGQVQAALDAAVLAGAKEMQAAASDSRIGLEVNNYFKAIKASNTPEAACQTVV